MSVNFDALWKRRTVAAIANSALSAISAGVVVYGILTLVAKLANTGILLPIMLAATLGFGLITGALTLLFTYKSKRRLARELDGKLELGERLETMIAFQNEENEMIKLQREDAQKHLESSPASVLSIKQFFTAIVSVILAVAIILPAVLIPYAEADTPDDTTVNEEELFELLSWQSERLKKLIETVEAKGEDEIDAEFKATTVAELKRLLEILKKTDTKKQMLSEVISSIVLIDAAAEETASFKIVALALFSAEPITSETDEETLDTETHKAVKSIAKSVIKLNGIAFRQDLKDIRKYFSEDTLIFFDKAENELTPETADDNGDTTTKEPDKIITVKDKLISATSQIRKTMSDKDIPEDDALKAHFLAFADTLEQCIEKCKDGTEQGYIDKAFGYLSDNVSDVLNFQYSNKAVRDNVISTLILIFGIDKSLLPKLLGDTTPTLKDSSEETGNSGETGSISGGYGDGNELYGSNDTIYDPFGKDGAGHKLYGDVYDEYYQIISDLLEDESISEETRRAMAEYFHKLSNGSGNN